MPSEVSIVGAHDDREPTVEELKRALAEAREEQGATAEILAAISSSPTDAQRAFGEIAASAARLCDAYDAGIFRVEGELLREVAHHGPIPSTADNMPLTRGFLTAHAVLGRQTIQVADLQAEADAYPESSNLARRDGHRTLLTVPLIHAGEAIGAITIRRTEVRLFSDKQIGLLQTFADQAVIAIENARLFEAEQARSRELVERTHELQESLEYQMAISNVLNVIGRSPHDLQPILNAITEAAGRLCSSDFTGFFGLSDAGYHIAATDKVDSAFASYLRTHPIPITRGSSVGRAAIDLSTVHIPDVLADPEYKMFENQRVGKTRTLLAVPLVHNGAALGVISLVRTAVRPFTQKQIELVTTFADQALIAIENTRLFEAEQARTKELRETLEYQTATSDVLGIISRSPSELQPVFDGIVTTAQRLCEAYDASIVLRDGDRLKLKAHVGPIPMRAEWPLGNRGLVASRSVMDKATIHVHDLAAPGGEFPEGREDALKLGFRSILAVPLVLKGEGIGTIIVRRFEVRPFSDRQIALLATFADQAVIAIENTRLFEAEQASKRELQESLEYQTATSNVLNVISRSPTDVQPVFESIAQSAAQLCGAQHCNVFRFDGRLIHFAATHLVPGMPPEAREANMRQPPIAPGRGSAAARSIAYGTAAEIPDIDADPDYERGEATRVSNLRSTMAVPMLKDGRPIGAIVVSRSEKGRFSERQIDLLKTFADQAVIAIENARLFEEVQARTREVTESLEYQTAISEVLSVISRSPYKLQPVLDAIVRIAGRLCETSDTIVLLKDGSDLLIAAHQGAMKIDFERRPISRNWVAGRSVVDPVPFVHIHDLSVADEEYSEGANIARRLGHRTALGIPLIRDGAAIGTLFLSRMQVRPFADKEIALLKTFTDQAVIAINNVGLFEEVQARNRDLTALGEVGRAVSSTLDLKVVLKTIVDRAVELSGTDGGSIFYYRGGRFELGETTGLNEEAIARFRKLDITEGQTGLGEAVAQRQPLQVPDIFQRPSNPLRDAAIEAGLHAGLIVPLFGSEGPLGALVLQRRRPGEFPPAVVRLMQSFADQSAIALENARLFNEIAQKSRELEIASQHKSQFVANMSHELRTPLAAILGYAELIQEGFYGALPEKSMDALTRIRSNGKHLLGLINTVLDIAKIESGQFTLNMAEYAIESVIETVRSATESLAQNKKLVLRTEVPKSLPVGLGDEQRLTQVLLNLVGNAIKFTDAGEVSVTAKAVDEHFAVAVTDTGPGIPADHCGKIFEQFHQVDSSNTKAKGGTGLGLAIAKQIVEMHGGRIWVESTVGKGSTFQMELPTRAEFRMMVP